MTTRQPQPETAQSKDYRRQTIRAYDAMAEELSAGYDDYFRAVAQQEAEIFLSGLDDLTILDLGCGADAASRFFASRGYRPICADLSSAMLELCRNNGLHDLVQLDLEHLPFRDESLAACWAHTSLIHVPKAHLMKTLAGIRRVLHPGGRLFVAVREGSGEGYLGSPGEQRWFANYVEGEIEENLPTGLGLVEARVTVFGRRRFLNYHLRKEG